MAETEPPRHRPPQRPRPPTTSAVPGAAQRSSGPTDQAAERIQAAVDTLAEQALAGPP